MQLNYHINLKQKKVRKVGTRLVSENKATVIAAEENLFFDE